MMKTLSKAEKTDVLLVLALAFQKKFSENNLEIKDRTVSELAEKNFSAINADDFQKLKKRAAFFDELPPENLNFWQEIQLDKLRRRGRATLLDENINPAHIAETLSREPKAIQNLILKNLPAELSNRIIKYLEIYFSIKDLQTSSAENKKAVNNEIVALVKRKFLANFVAFEDIYEPKELDKFSVGELEQFIYHAGLRETAIACRGIGSKETLAAFLNRFEQTEAREIARYMTELEEIKPFWVTQADELVRRSWRDDFPPDKVLRKIGFKLLALGFAGRDASARRYTAQKLSVYDAESWQKMLSRNEKKLEDGTEDEILQITKRQKSIERLAAKFAQNGRL